MPHPRLLYVMVMGSEPDINELARQVAVLEERMNTRQAEYESALDRFRADMASMREDFAARETRMLLAIAGMLGLAVAILGFVLS